MDAVHQSSQPGKDPGHQVLPAGALAGPRALPWKDVAFISLCGFFLPFAFYLAVGLVSMRALLLLLMLVATAYGVTSLAVTFETVTALPRRRARQRAPTTAAPQRFDACPAFTALVVAYLPNEQFIILKTLRHLLEVAPAGADVQVILAYNSPTSLPVEDELRALAGRDPRFLPLKVDGSRTKAENVNAALPHVRGKIIGLFDSDHLPEAGCFERAVRWLNDGYDVVQGRCVIRNGQSNWLCRLIRLEFATMYTVFHASRSFGADTAIFGGSNGYWRTDVLRSLKLDPEMLTEDIDVSVRTLLAGHRLLHDRSIISTELAPNTVSAWFFQRLRWAQGWYQVTRKRSSELLRSEALSGRQKLYWAYILPWREAFSVVAPQALPMLLAIVAIHLRFKLEWQWDPYLTLTTMLTLLSGCLSALVAHRHDALAFGKGRWSDTAVYIILSPFLALLRNAITMLAWLREARREYEWIATPREATRRLARSGRPVVLPEFVHSLPREETSPGDLPARSEPFGRHQALLLVSGLVLVGLVLRLYHLEEQSLWVDEGGSVWQGQLALTGLIDWLRSAEIHPPLYFVGLHLWLKISDSVFWIRLFSVIPSVLTIPLIYAFGRRLQSRACGVLAAVLLTISPLSINHAQDARSYSLLGLTTTAAGYCLVWGIQDRRLVAWLGYSLAIASTLYTHNVGGIAVVVTHVAVVVTLALLGKSVGFAPVALCGAVLAWLPWLPVLVGQVLRGGAYWLVNPSGKDLQRAIASFTSYGLPKPRSAAWPFDLSTPVTQLAIVLGSLAVVAAGVYALRADKRSVVLAVALACGPILLELDAGLIQPVFLDRTLISCSVLYLILFATGAVWLGETRRARPLAALSVTFVIGLNAVSLWQYYDLGDGQYVKERWDLAAQHVAEGQQSGDVILLQGNSSQFPFDYYYRRSAPWPLPEFGLPCTLGRCFRFEGRPTVQDQDWLAGRLPHYRRVWLVKRWWGNWDFTLANAVGSRSNLRFALLEDRTVSGVVVQLYSVTPSPLERRTGGQIGRIPP